MNFKISRRELLGVAGGAAVGAALTPAPWKLVDDLAIWTQNWGWIPVPPKGPLTTRNTVCSLCPAACPVRARCIGGLPVSLTGAPAEDALAGLCPLGLGGHHLPYHPARLSGPVRVVRQQKGERTLPARIDSIVNETARAIDAAKERGESVALLDMRPGRSASWAWRRLLGAIPNGVVISAPGREDEGLATLATMIGRPEASLGFDVARARMIVSFGAPLVEGWGGRATFDRLLRSGSGARLVQIDPILSATAQRADRWLAALAGSEGAIALGIARTLLAEGLVDEVEARKARDFAGYRALVAAATPERVARASGIAEREIVATAREMARYAPTIVIPVNGLDPLTRTAILGLDLLLGSVGRVGGVVERGEAPAPFDDGALSAVRELDDVEDRSIAVLVVDASAGDGRMPWSIIRRKLTRDALVVVLSPFFAGTARRADRIIPTLPYLETFQEIPAAADSPVSTFAVSTPILKPRLEGRDPIEIVRALASAMHVELSGEWKTSEDLMRARVARIHERGEGKIVGEGPTNVTAISSPDELWNALAGGARWEGDPRPTKLDSFSLLNGAADDFALWRRAGVSREFPLMLVATAPRDACASAVVSPVFTKLYQESGLRRSPGTVAINPATAGELGLTPGRLARLVTRAGAVNVRLAIDDGVMPGIVSVAAGPDAIAIGRRERVGRIDILDICSGDRPGGWRATAATLEEA